ncbi:Uncharacterised protein [Serratia plymuthica]|uniref:Serine acetyltransferase n=1 Tax=Serratia plymuthica TaxID=82996 RepID=A0A2X4V4Z4_SERPL|nr:Uncharacterised protein [Serratia plymuthica]
MTRFSQPQENTNWQLADIVNELRSARLSWRERSGQASLSGQKELPSKSVVSEITESLRAILFPMRLGPDDLRHESEDYFVGHTLDAVLNALLIQVRLALGFSRSEGDDAELGDSLNAQAVTLVRQFATVLPAIRRRLDSDILAAYHGDPSARSVDEVLLCFPASTPLSTTGWRTISISRAFLCWRASSPKRLTVKPVSIFIPVHKSMTAFLSTTALA